MSEIMATAVLISASLNNVVNCFRDYAQRKHSKEQAEENRQLTFYIESNRQNFQKEMHEKNVALQHDLELERHQYRVKEQELNFENMCKTAEWQKFMSQWPLITPPDVIRKNQLLSDGTVCLRVFFTHSDNQDFKKYVYPLVEQGLREFAEIYQNQLNAKHIIFYHNAFMGDISGGGINENLYFALKGLPVVIIDANMVMHTACVSLTTWGLGETGREQTTVLKIPFDKPSNAAAIDEHYSQFACLLLAYLKYTMGYTFDVYRLVQYGWPPLLPQAIQLEPDNAWGRVLDIPDIHKLLSESYIGLYEKILAPQDLLSDYSEPVNRKVTLHWDRLMYAKTMYNILSNQQLYGCFMHSLQAWVWLRSANNVSSFLDDVISCMHAHLFSRLFTNDDANYLVQLEHELSRLNSLEHYNDDVLLKVQKLVKYPRVWIGLSPPSNAFSKMLKSEIEKGLSQRHEYKF